MVNIRIEDYNSTLYDSIFFILKTSFDRLSQDDQLLFLDVALFSPKKWPVERKWLSVLHGDVKVAVSLHLWTTCFSALRLAKLISIFDGCQLIVMYSI